MRLMKTHYLVVQINNRLREIWELTLFKKGVTPGDFSKIWEKSTPATPTPGVECNPKSAISSAR